MPTLLVAMFTFQSLISSLLLWHSLAGNPKQLENGFRKIRRYLLTGVTRGRSHIHLSYMERSYSPYPVEEGSSSIISRTLSRLAQCTMLPGSKPADNPIGTSAPLQKPNWWEDTRHDPDGTGCTCREGFILERHASSELDSGGTS